MGARIEDAVTVGSWVVVGPTGRDMRECWEVGVVLEVRCGPWFDADDPSTFMVALNGSNEVVACTVVSAVLS